MLKHTVYANMPNGSSLKICDCETRELADLVAAAINAYKSSVQEEANHSIITETFRLTPDTVKVVEKAEVKA